MIACYLPSARALVSLALTAVLLLSTTGTVYALTSAPRTEVTVSVGAVPMAADLVCPKKRVSAKGPSKVAKASSEALELPSEEEVADALAEVSAQSSGATQRAMQPALPHAAMDQPLRVAIWGDSHLAAGFFTDELVSLLGVQANRLRSVFLPGNIGRPGVRLPYRKACVSDGWRYEPAYSSAAAAIMPGPGLVNLVAEEAGASLAIDVRDRAGTAVSSRVRVLYHQTAVPIRLGLSVDGALEQELVLSGYEGPGVVVIQADEPLSVIRLRVIEGSWVFQGIEAGWDAAAALQMDVFGFPGATVAGWRRAQLPYLSSWFNDRHYDLVMLMFGTNEGNVPAFDPRVYRDSLDQAVSNFRQVFPDSACILIGPGDRGARVPHRRKVRRGMKRLSSPIADPLTFSRVHERISDSQRAVASSHGCLFFSLQDSMGGPGSVYRWVRTNPPLMAYDLTHFTPAGYRELARRFASAMHWDANLLVPTP